MSTLLKLVAIHLAVVIAVNATGINPLEVDYQADDYGVEQPYPQEAPLPVYFSQEKIKFADDGKRRRRPKPQNLLFSNPQLSRKPAVVSSGEIAAALKNLTVSYRSVPGWPQTNSGIVLGGVSGVSLDRDQNVVIFHRANRIWSTDSFNTMNNVFMEQDLGPIRVSTILGLSRETGALQYAFGKDLFYLPHGITVDAENNVWVTDVALHQVMKLNREIAGNEPLIVLGTKLTPGTSRTSFCKPTSVAVLPNGDFFVADGYCNARIMKFNRRGEFMMMWGQHTFQGRTKPYAPENTFAVPHALTLALDKGLVCVADRENGRVQCFQHSNGQFHSQYHSPLVGDRLFSVTYLPKNGGQLYVLNGPMLNPLTEEVKGFVIDMESGNVTSKFPGDANYSNPHDIVVTSDGKEVYVAEYDPYRIHKLVSVTDNAASKLAVAHADNLQSASGVAGSAAGSAPTTPPSNHGSGARAFLIIVVVTVFGLLAGGVGLAVFRHRKRGWIGSLFRPPTNNRRHAWEFNKGEFKLAALIEQQRRRSRNMKARGKFEKLGQEESDEESEKMLKPASAVREQGPELA